MLCWKAYLLLSYIMFKQLPQDAQHSIPKTKSCLKLLPGRRRHRDTSVQNGADITITRYRDIAMSRNRDIAIYRYRGIASSRYRDIAILRHCDIAMSGYRVIAISRCRDITITQYRDIAASRYRDTAISRYRDIAMMCLRFCLSAPFWTDVSRFVLICPGAISDSI